MQFVSNLLGRGGQSDAQGSAQAAAGNGGEATSSLELLGGANDVLFSDGTKQTGGTQTTVGSAISSDAKLLLLYFSMHNCPPCREFTPLLVELYNEHNESGKVMEVIFLSGD